MKIPADSQLIPVWDDLLSWAFRLTLDFLHLGAGCSGLLFASHTEDVFWFSDMDGVRRLISLNCEELFWPVL